MDYAIDDQYAVQTLADLVKINSVNPDLVSGAPGELEIGKYIASALSACGIEPRIDEIAPGRVNVYGTLKGKGGGRTLLLNGHMDTVGVDGMSNPFSAEICDGKLFGRGALDMKGGLAAMLTAVNAISSADMPLNGDLIFTAVADEEYGSTGTELLVKYHDADAAIVTEPTNLAICLAHKGFCVFDIETTGKAAHGGCFEDGVDANMHMGRILSQLDLMSSKLARGKKHHLTGPPSLHVPLIKGGTELFIYSDSCKISVERRTIPGENHEEICGELENMLAELSAEDHSFNARLHTVLCRNPYEISPNAEIVTTLYDAVLQQTGEKPRYIGHSWWEDSALIAEAGIETVIIGPFGEGIHTHEEWVDIQSVIDLAAILVDTSVCFCN